MAAAFLAALYWSYQGTNADIGRLIDGLPFFWRFVKGMFPPNPGVLSELVTPVLQTIQMSILGTTLAVLLSLPFALLAARNTSPHSIVYQAIRMFLNANRSIPDLVIALMFVAAVGLGPFPGMMALAVGSIGFMGKLFAESFEQINPRQVEAVRATGANRIQVFRYAVMPQALPLLASYSLLLWEINVRSATILGLVGAGGIGLELQTAMRLFLYQDLAMIIILIIVMVTVIDRVSAFLRSRIT
jgi:phosphonate transport system permease protein